MFFTSLFLTIVAALLVACLGQAPNTDRFDLDAEVAALRSRVRRHGCNPRVCFALDGSGSISKSDWNSQKDFVLLVASIIAIDPRARFAAVQYGLSLKLISLLTSNIEGFLFDVDAAKQLFASKTFISSGLGFCISQLNGNPTAPAKIVVLGDGGSNFGGRPRPIARHWLNADPSNAICAVGVGFVNKRTLLQVTNNNRKRVLTVDQWDEVVHITRKLVEDICGLPARF